MKLLKSGYRFADISVPGGSLFGGVVIAARSPEVRDHASPATTAGYAAWNQHRAASIVATLFT